MVLEAVGLALGAVALLPTVYIAFDKSLKLISDASHFASDVALVEKKLMIQRNLFQRQHGILLKVTLGVDGATANQMAGDETHPQWNDPAFKLEWSRTLGPGFDAPIEIIHSSLNEIQSQFKKFLKVLQLGNPSGLPNTRSNLESVRMGTEKLFRRAGWAASGKTKVQTSINAIRDQILDLRVLLKQRRELEVDVPVRSARNPCSSKPLPTALLRIRESGKLIFGGLSSSANCPCHCVNLRLFSPTGVKKSCTTITSNSAESNATTTTTVTSTVDTFHALVNQNSTGNGEITHPQSCMYLTIKAEKQSRTVQVTRSIPPAITTSNSSLGTDNGQRRVRFLDDNSSDTLNDLCLKLSEPPTTEECCFGYLKTVNSNTNYRYVVYGANLPSQPSFSRRSLEELLERSNAHTLLLRENRIRIALHLAFSLLQFGSYEISWFRQQWRSKDIKFFLPLDKDLPEVEETGEPHLESSFSSHTAIDASKASAQPHQHICPNQHIFSLALVLLEIGLGRRLCTLRKSRGMSAESPQKSLNEIAEYLTVKSVVESGLLGKEMGADYAAIVRRCFRCEFGAGDVVDFSQRGVQEAFYGMVVIELERVLRMGFP